jgi:hypothetical protein
VPVNDPAHVPRGSCGHKIKGLEYLRPLLKRLSMVLMASRRRL